VSDFAQSVKQQADIVKVVEGYIRLRKAGAQNFVGLCPFHKEKSPSFNVQAVKQFYYCFGCQASGDVFSFVSKIENVTFPEAVRIVAQKAGIPLPKREFGSAEEAAEARLRGKLLELHEAAAAWFEEQLRGPEGALAREYLASRGLSDEGIKKFRIGYAPESFNALRDRLSGSADQETQRLSGLFSAKEIGVGTDGQPQFGPLYDRFRKRVTFPIANEGGRVIAFTARILPGGAEADKGGPKYLNSPETPIYTKGQVLFNLDKAKAAIRQAGFALLVEGQMDCISLFLRGIQNVIATSGTAMTTQQVVLWKRQLAARSVERVRVVANFDPDPAGRNAAAKTIDLLIEENFEIKLVTLADGLDPDRYIRERGRDAYIEAIRGAQRLEDFLIGRSREMFPGTTPEQKIKQLNYILPFIRRMPERVAREQFAADASQKLGIDSAVLRAELREAALRRRESMNSNPAGRPSFSNNWISEWMPKDREKGRRVSARMGAALHEGIDLATGGETTRSLSSVSNVERVLLRALANVEIESANARQAATKAVQDHPSWFECLASFAAIQALATRGAKDPLDVVEDPGQRALLAGALLGESQPPEVSEVEGALQEVRERAMESRQRDLRAQIAEAERQGDFTGLALLTRQKLDVDRALNELQRVERIPD
jgi:DNA primase